MDKDKKKSSVVINTIKNKQARERLWQQIKHKKKLEKKKRKVEKEKMRKELGEEAVPKEVGLAFLWMNRRRFPKRKRIAVNLMILLLRRMMTKFIAMKLMMSLSPISLTS